MPCWEKTLVFAKKVTKVSLIGIQNDGLRTSKCVVIFETSLTFDFPIYHLHLDDQNGVFPVVYRMNFDPKLVKTKVCFRNSGKKAPENQKPNCRNFDVRYREK